jgi:hypothetical protein
MIHLIMYTVYVCMSVYSYLSIVSNNQVFMIYNYSCILLSLWYKPFQSTRTHVSITRFANYMNLYTCITESLDVIYNCITISSVSFAPRASGTHF